jgi:hypothetical protein
MLFAIAVVAVPANAQQAGQQPGRQDQSGDGDDPASDGPPPGYCDEWPDDSACDPDWPDQDYPPGPPPDTTDPGGQDEPPAEPEPLAPPLVTTNTVAGKVAMLRTDGRAAIPRGAPKRVRLLIRKANHIIGKPYKWGGGHGKLDDRGYDCSGTVSYALIKAGLLDTTMVSGAFTRWGRTGAGRWISVYANRGHVYMEVAGLRLDTSSVGDYDTSGKRSGVRWRPVIGSRRGFKTRHPAGL